ncbi:MAG: enoyl-CoA hydratase [Pseudomonadota bacterium]
MAEETLEQTRAPANGNRATPAVLLEVAEAGVLTLTMNRPEARNALSLGLMQALIDRLRRAGEDKDVRAVVLRGAGPAFCAGHDLKEMTAHRADADRGEAHFREVFATCSELMTLIPALPIPVIAEVHGIASAAGCQLVASADLAVAAETARFATPGVNIGLFCSTPMVALSRAVSNKHAMEMLLTGSPIQAARAEQMGLVNRVVAEAELVGAVRALAGTIATKSAASIAYGKPAFYAQKPLDLAAAYTLAAGVMTENMLDAAADEGIGAFIAKRPPDWPERS